jgi:hypothetical protein
VDPIETNVHGASLPRILLAGAEEIRVVARDGYPLHSTLFQIGLSDSYVNPKGIEKAVPQCAA